MDGPTTAPRWADRRRRFWIGIAGPSGAGKSSLALRLIRHELPGGETLAIDAYYRDLAALPAERRRVLDFDHPRTLDRALLASHLGELAAGRTVEVPVYRFDTHTRAPGGRPLAPGPVLVVEGLFALLFEEVRQRLDLKVFVEAPRDVCLERRLERDVRERGRTGTAVRAQFLRTVWPRYERYVQPTRRHADLVLDGTRPLELLAAEIARRSGAD